MVYRMPKVNYKAGYSRARSYGGRARSYGKKRTSKIGVHINPAFVAGAILGFTNHDDKLPKQLVLGAAVAPVHGVKELAQGARGIIFGNMIQGMVGGSLGGGGNSNFGV